MRSAGTHRCYHHRNHCLNPPIHSNSRGRHRHYHHSHHRLHLPIHLHRSGIHQWYLRCHLHQDLGNLMESMSDQIHSDNHRYYRRLHQYRSPPIHPHSQEMYHRCHQRHPHRYRCIRWHRVGIHRCYRHNHRHRNQATPLNRVGKHRYHPCSHLHQNLDFSYLPRCCLLPDWINHHHRCHHPQNPNNHQHRDRWHEHRLLLSDNCPRSQQLGHCHRPNLQNLNIHLGRNRGGLGSTDKDRLHRSFHHHPYPSGNLRILEHPRRHSFLYQDIGHQNSKHHQHHRLVATKNNRFDSRL